MSLHENQTFTLACIRAGRVFAPLYNAQTPSLYDACRSELSESSSAAALIYDSATRMFWRNMQARATSSSVPPLGRTPVQWEVPEDVKLGKFLSSLQSRALTAEDPTSKASDHCCP